MLLNRIKDGDQEAKAFKCTSQSKPVIILNPDKSDHPSE